MDITNFKRVLAVVAHPDDEVLGCGGTLARFSRLGKNAHVLILGGVTTSRYKNNESEEGWKKGAFRCEAESAGRALGIRSLTRHDYADNRFDTVPMLEIVKAVEKIKRKVRPDLVLTHDYFDLNVDHKITHQAVITAFRPGTKDDCGTIMAFEVLSNTEFQDQSVSIFSPNCYVDITGTFKEKLKAMNCYKSELKSFPHPRSIKGIEALAAYRGMQSKLRYAEAFRIIRTVC